MRCFELVKKVLDEAYEEIDGDETARDEQIAKEFVRLSDRYSKLQKYQQIDYRNPVTRFVYVYKYVASHANIVFQLISGSTALRTLLKRESVDVACVGGGPGSDLLGIIKYLELKGAKTTLGCAMFDAETAWGETWFNVFREVDSDVRLFTYYNVFDVVDQKSWSRFSKYKQFDLFTMIYFMSEVFGLREKAEEYFLWLMSEAKQGALFLFVDNAHSDFSGWFDSLAKRSGLQVLETGQSWITVPPDEEKAALGEYFEQYSKLPDGNPKLKTNVCWRVAQKT